MLHHNMRLFHFYFSEVVDNLGASPDDIYPLLEKCRFYALVEKDAAELFFLEGVLEEFYGITPDGWAEWQS